MVSVSVRRLRLQKVKEQQRSKLSGYQKPCIFCKQEIKMSNDSGKWLPYSLDGSLHECRESRKDNNKTVVTDSMAKPYHQQQTSTLKVTITLESLDRRVKKLEESFDKHVKRIEAVLLKTRLD
jgi:hypothetical protein